MKYFILIFIMLLFLNLYSINTYNKIKYLNNKYNLKLNDEYIYSISKYYNNIPSKYVNTMIAISFVETKFNHNLVSKTKDYGICQINTLWGNFVPKLSIQDNIYIATMIFDYFYRKYNNIDIAIIRYNGSKKYLKKVKPIINEIKNIGD